MMFPSNRSCWQIFFPVWRYRTKNLRMYLDFRGNKYVCKGSERKTKQDNFFISRRICAIEFEEFRDIVGHNPMFPMDITYLTFDISRFKKLLDSLIYWILVFSKSRDDVSDILFFHIKKHPLQNMDAFGPEDSGRYHRKAGT